jgi:hypothetical protein
MMKKIHKGKMAKNWNIKSFLDETDIRSLGLFPSLIGFGGFLAYLFFFGKMVKESPYSCITSIFLGIACLISSLSGMAEIYKKQIPGPMGGVIEGKFAIVTGILMVVLFGGLGIIIIVLAIFR